MYFKLKILFLLSIINFNIFPARHGSNTAIERRWTPDRGFYRRAERKRLRKARKASVQDDCRSCVPVAVCLGVMTAATLWLWYTTEATRL